MATKKQKREAALAKREVRLVEERRSGLEAQEWDKERIRLRRERLSEEFPEIEAILAKHGIHE